MIIYCENKNKKLRVNIPSVKKIAAKAMVLLKKKNSEVNILFVSDKEIKKFNKKYLDRDTTTDVIAFWQDGGYVPAERPGFLGDIMISLDTVKRNAEEYGSTFRKETALCVIHGILHLSGYEDKTKKGKARMRKLEHAFLQKVSKFI